MVTFDNLRPKGGRDGSLLLSFAPASSPAPYPVKIAALAASEPSARWVGNLTWNDLYLLQTGYNTPERLYLTMTDDKPGQPTYMEKWLGTHNTYHPNQVWVPIDWPDKQWSFLTLNGHILQATRIDESSPAIVAAYPEYNTDNPTPNTPGQIWIASA